jgi:crossover junction endodeoxyribonuclease RuvC
VRFTDATDALAVALCHHFQSRNPQLPQPVGVKKTAAKKSGSWEAFLSMNPERVR